MSLHWQLKWVPDCMKFSTLTSIVDRWTPVSQNGRSCVCILIIVTSCRLWGDLQQDHPRGSLWCHTMTPRKCNVWQESDQFSDFNLLMVSWDKQEYWSALTIRHIYIQQAEKTFVVAFSYLHKNSLYLKLDGVSPVDRRSFPMQLHQ